MKNYSPNCGVSVRNQSVFIFLWVRHKGKRKITALFVKCTAKSIVLMLMQEKQNFNRRSTGVSRTQPTVLQSSLSDISLFQTQTYRKACIPSFDERRHQFCRDTLMTSGFSFRHSTFFKNSSLCVHHHVTDVSNFFPERVNSHLFRQQFLHNETLLCTRPLVYVCFSEK